ncbi:MAG: MBL fold metallo-hydrolase [Opitutaceae bacterium]|nr:MBL fold metallo-hydrolase [Opitutaceae bacterium]
MIVNPPLEDELGDVIEKAARHVCLPLDRLAAASRVEWGRIKDALDYRSELSCDELRRLAAVLQLNEVGLCALGSGKYPLPVLTGLPYSLHPLRMPFGVGVVNAYLVSTGGDSAILFDTGASHAELHRAWPLQIQRLEAVFVTHYEAEHIGGLETVLHETGLPGFHGPPSRRWTRCLGMGEGQTVEVGGLRITAYSTPGHASEHNCYHVQLAGGGRANGMLISGDLIFAGSLGGGYFCCERQLKHSRRMLEQHAPETVIAPGHGPLTTVGNERTYNPFYV